MEKVICVSTAKVPIVKIWDPELCLACDMNVNNTLALENTRMIKTYVQLDDRVRPLAMIIKYWTKRRIVNDAGKKPTFIAAFNLVLTCKSLWWYTQLLHLDMHDHQLSPN
jgi:DNA polymerase sigma